MIFGIGVDVLSADRMRKTFERFGERIVERLLMPAEREQLKRTARVERFLAMRFAAKEAIVKAMGTGFSHGIWIRDVGIVQNAWGKPEVVYSPRGELVRRKLGIGEGHVTLTDEAGLVVAVAVLLKATRTARTAKPRAKPKAKAKRKTKSKTRSKRPGKPKARAR
jgi:holo-[acyl-carrier protein] synthase